MTEEKNEIIFDDDKISKSEEFVNPEELYQELIQCVQKYHPSDDISMIEKAYKVASEAHKNQFRKSGEPYIIHPLNVAIILADLKLDKETIVAGILHDVVEDTVMTEEDLRREFGDDVALLVDGVTKLEKIPLSGSNGEQSDAKLEMQAENLRKMFLAMAKDIRVIMIKLADRLHNMRTLKYKTPESQQRIAKETLEIYCPIAQRLGISKLKIELDDLSLKYLEPDIYYDLVDKIAVRKSVREKYIQGIVDEVSEHIKNAGIEAKVDGRVKHFFSIYKKMKNQHKTLDQIYDLFAVRIIVETVKDCYAALGVIHEMYKPIPGRFKDYIAMPKANMYQSLHTTLIGSNGQPFEIQIRTFEMHRVAEYGIAAHWKYKEASDGKKPEVQEEEKLVWLRQILEWQRDMSDNKEFMNLLKNDLDLFSDSVYCFTPTGEVKNLPAGSTPIDFAYSIHSAVGNKMVGARVNGKLVTIDYKINNGDRIEIITSQNSKGPSRDWLNICKSNGARTKIKQWFKKEKREENIVHGKASFEGEMRRANVNPAVLQDAELLPGLLKKLAFECLDDMYAAIGYGGLTAAKAFGRIRDDLIRATRQTPAPPVREVQKQAEPGKGGRHKDSGVIVEDIDSCMIKFSRCCTPVPGDDIVGFITKGYGVSIHRRDCRNASGASDPKQAGRWVKVAWSTEDKPFSTTFEIDSTDRSGIWLDIATALSAAKLKVTELSGRDMPTGKARTVATFEVRNVQELETIRTKIRAIDGVIDVRRGQN